MASINVSPNPAIQGDTITITWAGTAAKRVRIRWPSGVETVPVSGGSGSFTKIAKDIGNIKFALEIKGNKNIAVTYLVVNEVQAPPPDPKPVISNILVSNISETNATVSWKVSEKAQGWVKYGLTTTYGKETAHETSLDYDTHTQTITGLVAGTLYNFQIVAVDSAGQISYSSNQTFTTQFSQTTPDCTGTLQSKIDAAAAGSVLNLTGCTFTAGATISKALTLVGAKITTTSRGLTIQSSNVTLDNVTITGPQATSYNSGQYGVYADGAYSNIRIKNSHMNRFGNAGIQIRGVFNLNIEDTVIEDCVYAGMMIISCVGGTITRNTVRRIGVVGASANGNNAYGIALTQMIESSPKTTDFTVSYNLVESVPTWQGLDTHGGARIKWNNNTVRGCRDGIYITGWPGSRALDNVIDNNTVENTTGSNQYGVTSVYSTGGAVTNNRIIGWMAGHEILKTSGGDPEATAINLIISNNIFQ